MLEELLKVFVDLEIIADFGLTETEEVINLVILPNTSDWIHIPIKKETAK